MKLSLIDFKKHSNSDFDLEGNICITGKNGEGKTSVLEGIVFALFGRNFSGGVATDTFVKKDSLGATAILTMGETSIKRTVGSENSVYLNGAKSKVAEAGSLFPSVDIAMPIINPLYFLYEMSDVAKRELFMKLLPQIDREEMFIKHYGKRKDLLDRFKVTTLKSIREQIKNSEVILKANESQITSYNLDISERENEIKRLRESMPDAVEGVLEREKEVQKELEETQKELSLLGNPNVRIDEYKKELEGFSEQAAPIVEKLKVKNLSEAIQRVDSGLGKLVEQYESLREEFAQNKVILEQLKKFESGRCPVCDQPVSSALEKTQRVKEDIEKNESELSEIKVRIEKYEGILKSLESLKIEVERCTNGINIHSKKVARYDKLVAKIKELEEQLVGNTKQDFENALKRERAQESVRLIQLDIMRKKGTVARLSETNEKLNSDMPDLKILEEALSNKGVDALIAKEQAKEIIKLVKPYVDINLVTVLENKTNDNTKEVFEVTKDGVSFRSMSFGERIKVSIAMGLALRSLVKGFNLPFVLLDEASVLSSDTLDEIKSWLKEKDIDLIYTKASNTKLTIKKDGD